ncbi:acyl-CoA dehydrogenase [Amycolatopsis sp.]|uniref:acyl-CoA dehydrogenase family protein n=1 Tax=Amycolatopsis sp. TaxID=37632 RepID=UPI002BCBF065|nr:acyl-CoA dehydrogenase [Amycolatopsis sp.]HVV10506.1 acyl-CoA dehydrogenase [Amycolatopsis sp.]
MLTAEQLGLQESVRDLFADHSTESRVRQVVGERSAFDAGLWERLAKLGLAGLIVGEESGGQGGTLTDLCVVLVEAGAALACVPLLATSGALSLLHNTGAADLVEPLATGAQVWTPALAEGRSGWGLQAVSATAKPGWTLSGTKTYVAHATAADGFVVSARTPDGPALFAVTADAAGVRREALKSLDATRPLGTVTFENSPARLLAAGADAENAYTAAMDVIAVLTAADAAGVARRCTAMAVDYAKTRRQFGRAIGSFQAIKHACADMAVAAESAGSLVWDAAAALHNGPDPVAASTAKAYCCDAAVHCAEENIQVHGGIGFTWEHPAHLYLRRAKGNELAYGSPAEHRDRVALALAAGV